MKQRIHTSRAPRAIGPYSQAIRHDGLVWSACQIALDPVTGELVGATAAEQTAQVLDNLAAVLEAAGSGFDRVLKATVLLVDLSEFGSVNEVYATRFTGAAPPARSAFQVTGLPRGALVGIECVAACDPT
ncbi:MAG: reactive intermediate/imine deaminase [Deltaproteobacteria bacterium]|nr:reactive intermediate/imine deaminase [Deltaproteobacteria bacterium]